MKARDYSAMWKEIRAEVDALLSLHGIRNRKDSRVRRKPSLTPKDNQEWEKRWEKDNQECEANKRDYRAYKAVNEAADEAAFYRFCVALSGEYFKKHRSRILGKLAAEDLKLNARHNFPVIAGDAAELILQATRQGDAAFFMSLARSVIGKKSNAVGLDKFNMAIARLIYEGNAGSVRARKKLIERFPHMEANLREYLKRLLDALPAEYQYLDHRGKQRREGKKRQNRNKRNRT